MLKKLMILLLGLAALVILAFGGLLGYGFYEANRLNEQEPMADLVAEQQAKEDYVSSDQIAPFLLEATVAVEDDAFYSHPGVDFLALIRALASQILPFLPPSGGSTITQQVVKNLYGHYNGNWSWKLCEMALAFRLESMLNKEEILDLYVNIINYGDGYTGIEEAANGYFDLPASMLDPAQCSLLAGIPQSPSNLQLSNHAPFAKLKQKVVLQAMFRNNMISEAEMNEIFSQPIEYLANGQWQQLLPLSSLSLA